MTQDSRPLETMSDRVAIGGIPLTEESIGTLGSTTPYLFVLTYFEKLWDKNHPAGHRTLNERLEVFRQTEAWYQERNYSVPPKLVEDLNQLERLQSK